MLYHSKVYRSVSLTTDHYSISPEVHLQVVTPPNQYELSIQTELSRTFEYIHTHIHHMCFELLKNSLRATIEYTARIYL